MEGKEQVCEWLETKVPLGSSAWQRIAYKMTNLPKCDLFRTFYWPTERNPNDRPLQYKQPRQESCLCYFSFARYSRQRVTQIEKHLSLTFAIEMNIFTLEL